MTQLGKLFFLLAVMSPTDSPLWAQAHGKMITGPELERLIVGSEMLSITDIQVTDWGPEVFLANGEYKRRTHRSWRHGSYTVSRSALCVKEEQASRRCRYLFATEEPEVYWISYSKRGDAGEAVTIKRGK